MKQLEDVLGRSFPDTLLVIDRKGVVRAGHPGTQPVLFDGDPAGAAIGALWPAPVAETVARALRRVLKGRRPHSCRIALPAGGAEVPCEARFVVHGRDSVLMLIRDAASLEAAGAGAARSAPERDADTGLCNRRWFVEQAVDRFNEARLREESVAVLVIEFPEIDSINASFGRRVSAELITVAAQRIASRTRANRAPDERDQVALIARDALGLVVRPVHSREQVGAVAARIREALDGPFAWQGREFTLKSGIGIAMFPRDGEDVDVLLRNAHMALAEAAFSRGSDAVFYSDTMPVRSLARLDVQEELRIAIEGGQLTMRYTPWLRTAPRRLAGLEVNPVLLSPVRGELGSERLVQQAEATGLAGTLLQRVLEAALARVPTLLCGPGTRERERPRIHLQLRSSQLDPDLPAELTRRCRQHGAAPAQLCLSVPESVLLQGELVEILTRLRTQGIRVVVRDFGAGQVRLAGLGAQPLWGVQLAEQMVAGLASRSGRRTCEAVVQFARSLGLRVLAPGLTNEREVELLESCGCTDLAGPRFGMELSEEALAGALAEPRAPPAPGTGAAGT